MEGWTAMNRRGVLWAAGVAALVGSAGAFASGGRAMLGRLTGDTGRHRVWNHAMAAGARDVTWPDLMPDSGAGPSVRRLDGSAPTGLIQHGEVTVVTGGAMPDKPGLDRGELVRRLGGTRSADGQRRRRSDTLGGLGNLRELQPPGGSSRSDLDGQVLRLAGFVLALQFEDRVLTDFLLVPYVGACSHVPPPPANQIVFVSGARGMDVSDGQFSPVRVTGLIETAETDTEFAVAGYRMLDPVIERVGGA